MGTEREREKRWFVAKQGRTKQNAYILRAKMSLLQLIVEAFFHRFNYVAVEWEKVESSPRCR